MNFWANGGMMNGCPMIYLYCGGSMMGMRGMMVGMYVIGAGQ